MGLQDRDYYREEYAKKNGMRYNKRNATYSAAVSASARVVRAASGTGWHWSLKLVLWLLIALAVLLVVQLANWLAS